MASTVHHLVPKFGEIVFADLPMDGSVQGGSRPVLVIQNDKGNQHSTTVEVLPLTSRIRKGAYLPTHVIVVPSEENGLRRTSVILAENAITIPMERLIAHLGFASEELLRMVGKARAIQSPLPR